MKQLESFFWGIPAALGALIIELIIFLVFFERGAAVEASAARQSFFAATLTGLVIAALVEESFKYFLIAKRIDYFSLGMSYLFNSLLFGLGFFATEFFLQYLSNPLTIKDLIPLFGTLCVHVGTSGIIGYAVATKNPKKISTIIPTILFVVIIHTAYNILILNRNWMLEYLIYALITYLIYKTIKNIFGLKKHLAM